MTCCNSCTFAYINTIQVIITPLPSRSNHSNFKSSNVWGESDGSKLVMHITKDRKKEEKNIERVLRMMQISG